MRNDMRPELSQKNPYWIGKHRYYELKHFCLQYPIWKKARLALDGLSRRPADLQVFVSCGQAKGDPTERCASPGYSSGSAWRWWSRRPSRRSPTSTPICCGA